LQTTPPGFSVGSACYGIWESVCPKAVASNVTVDVSKLPDGIYTGTWTATDAVLKSSDASSPSAMTLKVDRTKPDSEVGGELYDLRAETLTGNSYQVEVDAQDSAGNNQSGVRKVQFLAGNSVATLQVINEQSQTCPNGNCDLDYEYAFDVSGYQG